MVASGVSQPAFASQCRRSGVFIVNFEQISHIVLVFPFLTFAKEILAGLLLPANLCSNACPVVLKKSNFLLHQYALLKVFQVSILC